MSGRGSSSARPRRGRGQPSYHHGDLRRTLLAAARRTLERHGVEALSLRELARAANVSHNAPYRHFPGRADLLRALADVGFAELAAALAAVEPHADADRRLVEMGVVYVRFAVAQPRLFALMFGARGGRAAAGSRARRAPDDESAAVRRRSFALLAEQVAADGGDGEADRARTLAAWALVHGLAHLLIDRQVEVPQGTEFDDFVRAVLRARGA